MKTWRYNQDLCPCARIGAGTLWRRLRQELVEYMAYPCKAEACDVSAILSQLIWQVTRIPVMLPGAQRSFQKGRERFWLHGCVRSRRNAINHDLEDVADSFGDLSIQERY